ncbi:DUF1905 domain-containing protein [Nocardioides sp. GY 10113]|uniref:DUF1905 domain-containing protein n=1 Tax=Nocardioides sp. GY 10113 TaxID=2569761 RepID=UPI0010A7DDBC|nr:DUF1905 domain-containing protein [Nocardioides sp. GY 10113]TIC87468.1 DUF1905 domain-containing protein [Nocardioides sp. GY 10113]
MTVEGTATTYEFAAELWQWQARDEPGGWWFVALPFDVADAIDEAASGRAGGFGSVRVEVTVGSSTWRTSVFPSQERKTFVLPVKKAVRVREGLVEGGPVDVALRAL